MWSRFLLVFLLLTGVCFATGAAVGAVFGFALAAMFLGIWLVRHLYYLSTLNAWLRDPAPEAVPEGWGMWEEVYAALYRLLRRQRQSESRLTATLADFQRAAAAMPDGVVILGEDDTIEWCNPRAEAHLGLDRKRDIGQGITYMVRQPEFSERLRSGTLGEPLTLRQTGGADITLAIQIVPYGEHRKLVLSRDVTDRERVDTMRRDFIANVSHELRTPITVLSGFLETITETRADPELLRRSLPLMSDQARRMQRLVEDLLTLSRLESANDPVRDAPVDMPRLIHELVREALALSGGRHRIVFDADFPSWLLGAEEELRSACGNLISNAVRYTPDAGEIRVAWGRSGDGAVFSVRDTGIGIASQHIPRLTERFYRVDRGRSRETGGTGLGLAIVKHVVNRHQARLEIDSEPGRGSTFSVVFPAERVVEPGLRRVAAASA